MINLFKKLDDPKFSKKVHAILAIVWLIASIPIMIWFKNSISFLVFISVYACVASHWSGFDAAGSDLDIDAVKSKLGIE